MTYELAIHPEAEREWVKRDESIKKRFKQKLKNERLVNPRLAKDALHGLPETYKIKMPQFRWGCHVDEVRHTLIILAVSARDDFYGLIQGRRGRRIATGSGAVKRPKVKRRYCQDHCHWKFFDVPAVTQVASGDFRCFCVSQIGVA